MASRVAVTTGAPASASAFTPTLPTHQAGDRLVLIVEGKIDTTTIPTINQGWTLVGSATGGSGVNLADTGTVFSAVYAKDAASSSETAPTVTPGAVAPNSWEWICVSHRPTSGATWRDSIAASAAWVGFASDTNTASPLTGSAATSFAKGGDAIFVAGNIPTDAGTGLTAGATLTATGLSGGSLDNSTGNYVENNLGNDSAAAWLGWTGFTGDQSANLTASMTITSSANHAGVLTFVALREWGNSGTLASTLAGATLSASGTETISGTLASTLAGATLAATGTSGSSDVTGTLATTLAGATLAATGAETIAGTLAATLAGATLAASGVETITGTMAPVLAGAAMSASGTTENPGGSMPGALGDTLQYSMNRKAGTLVNGVPTLDAQGAANVWAGTTGLSLVGALNVKALNTLPNYRELTGVLNQLAGITDPKLFLEADAAAAAIP